METGTMKTIELTELSPWKGNPRGPVQPDELKTLTASIAAQGILQPLIVRPRPGKDGGYEVLAGNRRLAAAAKAGLPEAPCRVVEACDDRTAAAIALAENMERADLTPIEEADAVALLLKGGATAEDIARRLGRTTSWVSRHANIATLPENWRKLAAAGVSVSILEQVARLPAAAQKDLAQGAFTGAGGELAWHLRDARNFRERLAHHENRLNGAPFRQDDETLCPKAGACTTCIKRSGAQPLLWETGETEEDRKAGPQDRCTDAGCYEAKCQAGIRIKAGHFRDELPNGVLLSNYYGDLTKTRKAFGADVFYRHSVSECPKKAEAAVPALVIDGEDIGRRTYVRKPSETRAAARSKSKAAKDGKNGTPASAKALLAEKLNRLDQRRAAFMVKTTMDAWSGLADDEKAALELVKNSAGRLSTGAWAVPRLAAAFGTTSNARGHGWEKAWKAYARYEKCDMDATAAALLREVAGQVAHTLNYADAVGAVARKKVARIAWELLGRKWDELEAKAAEEIPEPKIVTRLRAEAEGSAKKAPKPKRSKGGAEKGAADKKSGAHKRAKRKTRAKTTRATKAAKRPRGLKEL